MTTFRRTSSGPVQLMPGPGTEPRPGGGETLVYSMCTFVLRCLEISDISTIATWILLMADSTCKCMLCNLQMSGMSIIAIYSLSLCHVKLTNHCQLLDIWSSDDYRIAAVVLSQLPLLFRLLSYIWVCDQCWCQHGVRIFDCNRHLVFHLHMSYNFAHEEFHLPLIKVSCVVGREGT